MNFSAGYWAPLGEDASWGLSIEGRTDPNNVAGTHDVAAVFGARLRL